MDRTEQLGMREVHLSLPLTDAAVRPLELGDAVFLSAMLFTGREGFYQTAFRQHGAIYLTTVGYGLGAIYGQGIREGCRLEGRTGPGAGRVGARS